MIVFIFISVSFLGVEKDRNILGTYSLSGQWNTHWLFSRRATNKSYDKEKVEPKYAEGMFSKFQKINLLKLKLSSNTHSVYLPLCS